MKCIISDCKYEAVDGQDKCVNCMETSDNLHALWEKLTIEEEDDYVIEDTNN